jgi:hydroxyacyl-ACP dehydratase HTD2-like protein with hotdog domain
MFRAASLSRRVVIAPLRRPHPSLSSRSLSEDTKQKIIQKLLSSKPVLHVDELTYTKRDQWEAAIGGFLPLAERDKNYRGSVVTHLTPGQHLLYCNTTVPTEQLLPDGTDTAFSPPSPWSNRLWAGGRIRFPQPHQLGIVESPRIVLNESVRDVRITGPEGEEKIFVKIERRVAKLDAGRPKVVGYHLARKLRVGTEAEIGISLIVETRDLCFLRENTSTVPYERRHITPPYNPDYYHSLTPTPALLFRFSALTYNAHAIHIDPEYTRKVYGFPNLLVHGPLSLALMLEYVRRTLFKISGQHHYGPVVTEINYRNLAPLFANEEMTICIKKKQSLESAQTSTSMPSTKESDEGPRDISPQPLAGDSEAMISSENGIHESNEVPPPQAIASESGVDIGKGFPTPPSGDGDGEDLPSHQEKHSKPTHKPTATVSSSAGAAAKQGDYPQEWDVWIQTGKGADASLAVRGTVKIEYFKKPKPVASTAPPTEENKPTHSPRLTKEETEMLQKVKDMLAKKATEDAQAKSQPRPTEKTKKNKSSTSASAKTPAGSTTRSRETSPPIIRVLTKKHPKAVPDHKARNVSTQAQPVVTTIRRVRNHDGVRNVLVKSADADDMTIEEMLSGHDGGSKIASSAEGAFARTLRVMLEGTK